MDKRIYYSTVVTVLAVHQRNKFKHFRYIYENCMTVKNYYGSLLLQIYYVFPFDDGARIADLDKANDQTSKRSTTDGVNIQFLIYQANV